MVTRLAAAVVVTAWCSSAVLGEPDSPIQWEPPATFDPQAAGLGLPYLEGTTHTTLYDPSRSLVIRSTQHPPDQQGWCNHHTDILTCRGWIIVTWTDHLSDENAAGAADARARRPI